MPTPSRRPDQDRLWEQLMALAEFREVDQPGFTRRAFSVPYQESRAWVIKRMEEVGLAVRIDSVGNLLGEMPGAEPDLSRIVIGSHTDTVAGGGRFDGMVGVIGSIEVARLLGEEGARLRHPLVVADFLGEEPNRFGLSCVGSRAVSGQLTDAQLTRPDLEGSTLSSALRIAGAQPQALASARWTPDQFHCFLELHIEQGRRLEQAGSQLGVVAAIAGIHRGVITWTGRPDHAGTTDMAERRDALTAAAEGVLLVESLARESGLGVGTVGQIEITPGAGNVIPGTAIASLELRSADAGWLVDAHQALAMGLMELASRRQLDVQVDWVSAEAPTPCHPGMRRVISEAIEGIGHRPLELTSGASHDAAHAAHVCPMGMIFIPSQDGRSHCPEEWSQPQDVALGVAALLEAVIRLDGLDSL
ncbi:MAG TPA: Zn-dependent hydrolase [Candidatus Dormibacteraeota bacterium]|nr:Zn-dependent hydrolase [Candidatus Dormibacteraeota bacterium]